MDGWLGWKYGLTDEETAVPRDGRSDDMRGTRHAACGREQEQERERELRAAARAAGPSAVPGPWRLTGCAHQLTYVHHWGAGAGIHSAPCGMCTAVGSYACHGWCVVQVPSMRQSDTRLHRFALRSVASQHSASGAGRDWLGLGLVLASAGCVAVLACDCE